MILTLIKLRQEFDSIQEQILTGLTNLSFDEVFTQLPRHSSIMTQSRHFDGDAFSISPLW